VSTPPAPAGPPSVGRRLSFIVVALVLLVTAALVPFAVGSALDDLVAPSTSQIYQLLPPQPPAPPYLRVHLIVAAIDIVEQTATIQVAAYQVCPTECRDAYELLLISTWPAEADGAGVPPSASVAVPAGEQEVNATVTLPLDGASIRYPFDTYHLGFGVVLKQRPVGGSAHPVTPAEAQGHLFVSLQTKVEEMYMAPPRPLSAESIPVVGGQYPFLTVREAAFDRPFYVRTLTVLLVVLIAAASGLAVVTRPVDQAVINVGALVLGIWGVRALLIAPVGTTAPMITAVDLALILVLLFLLVAIVVRSVTFLYARSGFRLPARLRRRPSAETSRTDGAEPPPRS
jgi:hypothetical protein